MQMVKRILLIVVVALGSFLVFAPKRELYYLLERQIKPMGITLHGEALTEHPLGLTLSHATLLYRGLPIGTIKDADFTTLLLYTQLRIHDFQLSSSLQKILHANPTIQEATVEHRFWMPMKIFFQAQGSLGKLQGWVDFAQHKIHFRLLETGQLDGLTKYLRKGKEGWYYEQRF